MNKRRALSECMARSGLLPLMRGIDRKKPSLKILAFHRIKNIVDEEYLFDEHLVDASVEVFDQQMAFISKHYKVLPLTEAYEEFSRTGNANIIAVTFDDGFDDLYFNAFPILKKYSIRPTMFLTTGLIGTEKTLWSEEVVFALKSYNRKSINLHYYDSVIFPDDHQIGINSAREILLSALKTASDNKRKALVKQLFTYLDIPETISSSESKMLTWDMVKEMSRWGVEFGSHSISHGVLSNLGEKELSIELLESKSLIESTIGVECNVIAYPVGGSSSYNPVVISEVKKNGYFLGCTYLSGVNYKDIDPFELKRLHVDSSVSINWFKGIVTLPSICAADFQRD